MGYFERGLFGVLVGAILVGLGSLAISWAWHLLGQIRAAGRTAYKPSSSRKRKRMSRPLAMGLLIAGPIVVAGGAALSTYGWNELDNHAEKRALIVSVIREWKLNNALLPICYFDEEQTEKLAEAYEYPQFQWYAAYDMQKSPLFNPDNPDDYGLLHTATKYGISAMRLQELLNLIDGRPRAIVKCCG